jgi:rare lipoprotein A
MRRRVAYGLAVLLLVVSVDAGAGERSIRVESGHANSKAFQRGLTSWHGKPYDGKTTASGERFNMYDFTAAHPNLPFGTYVRVTNLRNGKTVIVRINDRGPGVKGQIIDVSYSAARAPDFTSEGIQLVRLDF